MAASGSRLHLQVFESARGISLTPQPLKARSIMSVTRDWSKSRKFHQIQGEEKQSHILMKHSLMKDWQSHIIEDHTG